MTGLGGRPVEDALEALASRDEPMAAGVAAALTAATAASLLELSAGLASARLGGGEGSAADAERMTAIASRSAELRPELLGLADADADAYSKVAAASPEDRADALWAASEPPRRVAELSQELADAAAEVVHAGDWPFTPDAAAGGVLAAAAARTALALVAANGAAGG